MIAKQLSVFLENKTGRLQEVATLLAGAKINMSAFSIADSSDFGILRVMVSEPESAVKLLRKNHFSANLTDVICLNCPNEAGALAKALQILTKEGVEIEYMYAFSMNASANVIIKPSDPEQCVNVLQKHKLDLIAANELYKL